MREQIEEAMAEAHVVALDREVFEDEGEIGYIVGLGPSLVLLLRISDSIRFDGFSVMRIEDVSNLEMPHEHEAFIEGALRLREENVDGAPEVDLSGWASTIRTLGRLFDLVTIHTEMEDAGICQIGHVQSVGDEDLRLVTIDPDADWAEEAMTIRLDQVTRVDVGGGYEEALLLVGGRCPVPILRSVD